MFVDSTLLERNSFHLLGTNDSLIILKDVPNPYVNMTENIIVSFNFSTVDDGLIMWYGMVRYFHVQKLV